MSSLRDQKRKNFDNGDMRAALTSREKKTVEHYVMKVEDFSTEGTDTSLKYLFRFR